MKFINALKKTFLLKCEMEKFLLKLVRKVSKHSGIAKPIRDAHCCSCEMSLDDLLRVRSFNPSTYLAANQAEAVNEYLQKSQSMTDMLTRISKIVKEGKVKNDNETIILNPKTIAVLKAYSVVS